MMAESEQSQAHAETQASVRVPSSFHATARSCTRVLAGANSARESTHEFS